MGSYSTGNVRGSFNLPLGNTTAVRLSASHRSHDGFTENVPNPQSSARNVPGEFEDLDDENNTSLNGQFLWDISDRVSARVSYQKFDQDIAGPALKGGFDTVSDDPRTVSHDTDEFFEVDNEIISLIVDGSTDFAGMKALVSRQNYRMSRRLDADRSSLTANDPAPLPTPASGGITELGQLPIRQHVGGLTQEDETLTAEFNIASPAASASRFSWQGGAFWLDTKIDSNTRNFVDNDRDGEPVNTEILGFGNPDLDFQNSDRREFESRAVFGQVGYALTDRLNLTGGARWTRNEFEDERCNVFNGCLTNDGRTGTPGRPSESNSNVTYKVVLDYALNDRSMIYGSVATGIKPAASNNGFVEDSDGTGFFPEVFEEEEVRAYEIGSKNLLWDQRLMLNVAAYYYDIDNYLFNSAGLNLTGNGVAGGSNLPTSESYGIEIESSATLTDRLRLDLMVSASESEITSSRLAVDRGEQVNRTAGLTDPAEIEAVIRSIAQDLEGNELPKMPELVANARLSHDQPIDTGSVSGLLTSTFSYRYRGEYYNRVFNSEERDLVPSYHMADLNFRFVPDNSQWRFDLNVQNLFDKDEVSSLHTDDYFQGVSSFELLPPRVITLQARYDF
jgi:iron complex outermembrane receptor protein